MQRQNTALIGCVLLAVGVYAPVVHVPMSGSMTYLEIGAGEGGFPIGKITLGIAACAFLATLARWFELLWIAGAGSLALETWTYLRIHDRIAHMKQVASEANDSLAGGVMSMVSGSLRMEWGWPVLAVGGVALLAAAAMRPEKTGSR